MDFALRLATAANASSLAILEYGLAPGLQHPGQLIQAIEALRHLLRSTNDRGAGYNASEVVLFGDSAGGNMVAGVLAHLRYASPYAKPVELPGQIGAAVMLSPWVSMRHDEDSYVKNAGWDTIDVAGGQDSRAQWQPKEGDRFADMLCDSNALKVGPEYAGEFWASVFQGEDEVVGKAVVLVGEDEIIFDDVVRFGKMAMAKVKIASQDENMDGGDSVMLVQCPGETHCGAILDVIAGVDTTKCMLAELLAWLKEV
jgi:acetyl esterase/lipase